MKVSSANLLRVNWIIVLIYGAIVVTLVCQHFRGTPDGITRELCRSKPMFFAVAFAIVGLTLVFPTGLSRNSEEWKSVILAATVFNISGGLDTVIIFFQQQRGVASHFNHSGLINQTLSFVMSALSFALLASIIFYMQAFGKESRNCSQVVRAVGLLSSLVLALGMTFGFLMIAVGYLKLKGGAVYADAVVVGSHDLRTFHVASFLQFPLAMVLARLSERYSSRAAGRGLITAGILIGAQVAAFFIVVLAFRVAAIGGPP